MASAAMDKAPPSVFRKESGVRISILSASFLRILSAAANAAAGRLSMGGLPPRSGRRDSLLAVSNVRRASGATPGAARAASGATPGGAAQPTPVNPNLTGQEGKLPTPWSTLRPWDGKTMQGPPEGAAAGGEAQQAEPAASGDENQAGPPQQQAAEQQAEPGDGKQQQGGKASASTHAAGSGTRRTARHAAAEAAVAAADSDAPGPTHGCIALTSVDPAVVDLARSATRRLRGLRLCPEGREEGQVRLGAGALGGQAVGACKEQLEHWCATVLCHYLAQDARRSQSQCAATCCPAPPADHAPGDWQRAAYAEADAGGGKRRLARVAAVGHCKSGGGALAAGEPVPCKGGCLGSAGEGMGSTWLEVRNRWLLCMMGQCVGTRSVRMQVPAHPHNQAIALPSTGAL